MHLDVGLDVLGQVHRVGGGRVTVDDLSVLGDQELLEAVSVSLGGYVGGCGVVC